MTNGTRQRILIVACDGCAYRVPFVEEEEYFEYFFLKTVIPSRKATRDFLSKDKPYA